MIPKFCYSRLNLHRDVVIEGAVHKIMTILALVPCLVEISSPGQFLFTWFCRHPQMSHLFSENTVKM